MTGTTFVSSIDIGHANLLRVHFHLMYTCFLYIFGLQQPLANSITIDTVLK